MAKETYELEKVPATLVAADKIDETLKAGCIDLASAALGGQVLAFSDEFYADVANLIVPTAPRREVGKFVFSGAWYDGWETSRHNPNPFDYTIIRLGVSFGIIEGIEVDTAFFNGNHAPAISVEGCCSTSDAEVVGWKWGRGNWESILGFKKTGPAQRHGWKLDKPTKPYTHVRLNMHPDGGIARLRVFGRAVPVFDDSGAEIDLAAAQNGGMAIACNDEKFGSMHNLILPGRGIDSSDGWETSRSREEGHVDYAILRLGVPGTLSRFLVDTAYFRRNFPESVRIMGIDWRGEGEPSEMEDAWTDIIERLKCRGHHEHEVECLLPERRFTHVKLIMNPDGGVKRLRVFGKVLK